MREKLKKFWIVPVLCAIAAGLFIFKSAPEPETVFKSSAVLQVNKGDYYIEPIYGFEKPETANNSADAFSSIVRSTAVMLPAVKKAGIIGTEYRRDDIPGNAWLNAKLKEISSCISVQRISGSGLIKIEFTGENEDIARNLVNCLAQSVIDYDTAIKNRPYNEKQTRLEARLNKIMDDLADSELEIENFRVQNPAFIAFGENEYRDIRDQLKTVVERKLMLEIQIEQLKDRFNSSENSFIDWISGNQESKSLAILNKRLIELQLEKEELLVYHTPKSPDIIDLETKIQKIIGDLVKEFEVNLTTLNLKEENLKEKLASAPQNEKIMRQLERDFQLKEELYSRIYRELEVNKLAQAEIISDISVLEYAVCSEQLVHDHRPIHAAAGTLSGLLVGTILLNLLSSIYGTIWLIIHGLKELALGLSRMMMVIPGTFLSLCLNLFRDWIRKINDLEFISTDTFDILIRPEIDAMAVKKDIEQGSDGAHLIEDNAIITMELTNLKLPQSPMKEPVDTVCSIQDLRFSMFYLDWLIEKIQPLKLKRSIECADDIDKQDPGLFLALILQCVGNLKIPMQRYGNFFSPHHFIDIPSDIRREWANIELRRKCDTLLERNGGLRNLQFNKMENS